MKCRACLWFGIDRPAAGWVQYPDSHEIPLCREHFEGAFDREKRKEKPIRCGEYGRGRPLPDLEVLEGGR